MITSGNKVVKTQGQRQNRKYYKKIRELESKYIAQGPNSTLERYRSAMDTHDVQIHVAQRYDSNLQHLDLFKNSGMPNIKIPLKNRGGIRQQPIMTNSRK